VGGIAAKGMAPDNAATHQRCRLSSPWRWIFAVSGAGQRSARRGLLGTGPGIGPLAECGAGTGWVTKSGNEMESISPIELW
jgi:hypothetical protein